MKKMYQLMLKLLIVVAGVVFSGNLAVGQNAPVTTALNDTSCLNGLVEIPVTVSSFNQIKGLALHLDLDPTKLDYLTYTQVNPNLPGLNVSYQLQAIGLAELYAIWAGATAVDLPDGDTLFVLQFTLTGSSASLSFNNTANGGTDCQYIDQNGSPLNDEPTADYYHNAAVQIYSTPGQPSTIVGNVSPCKATAQNYVVTQVPGTTYQWEFPSGWTIVNGQGTNSVTVTTGETSGNITVTPSNQCGTQGPARTLAVSVMSVPAQLSPITGPSSPCNGSTITYSVTPAAGVDYTWSIPAGSTIISGQGTNALVITVGPTSGIIKVTPSTVCGAGIPSQKNLTPVVIPTVAPVITGHQYPCKNSDKTYSVAATPGTTYVWTVPSGYTMLSGQGTPNLTIRTGINSGTIQVTPSNSCGTGVAGSLLIEPQDLPTDPGTITGEATPCETSAQIYSVIENPIYTYTWTVPGDWSINSGQGTDSAHVTVGQIGGPIQVASTNDCGTGPASVLIASIRSLPGTATGVAGNTSPCTGNTESYTVDNLPGVSFNWDIPSDWVITYGQGTDSIAVTVGTVAGTIVATPQNSCGSGTGDTLEVQIGQVPGIATPIQGSATPCQGALRNYYVTSVAGITYQWTVPTNWQIVSGQGTSVITVLVGTDAGIIQVVPANQCGNGPARTKAVTPTLLPTQPAAISGNAQPCSGISTSYSVASQTGITYTWVVPTGWIISNGQGTSTITVTTGTAGGDITVTPSNICGAGTPQTLTTTLATVPDQPSAVSGEPQPCQGNEEYYEVVQVTGVDYNWTVPADWILTSGQGTNGILVTVGAVAGNITAVPSNTCGNGLPSTLAVTAIIPPTQPSPITGPNNPCEGQTLTYSVNNVAGITYTWQFPSGWIINNGQGTNTIQVIAGSNSGNISVTPENSCGQANPQLLAVTVSPVPSQPSVITGLNNPCVNSIQAYSVEEVTGLNYQWSFPSGWGIVSGQGTSAVEVTTGSGSGLITVTPSNNCGSGTPRTLAVTPAGAPQATSPISGLITPCEGTIQNYSVVAVAGITYDWTVPSGSVINAGQGTNSINATIGNTSGIISVTPSNNCGNGTATNLVITINPLPVNPGTISGAAFPCQGSNQTYSVFNQTGISYNWQTPAGWIIVSGQGTSSIVVTPNTSQGDLTVTPSNACGNGQPSSLAVTPMVMPSQPSQITGPADTCQLSTNLIYNVEAIPGVTHTWVVPNGWNILAGQGTNTVVVNSGLIGGTITVFPSNSCGTGPERTLAVTLSQLPAQPASVIGSTNTCAGTTQTYSVPQTANETYQWDVPAGWVVLSGQGTATITTLTGFNGGNLVVTPYNGCGAGTPATLQVDVAFVTANAGPDQAIAPGTSTTLTGGASSGSGNYLWDWQPAALVTNPSNQVTQTVDLTTPTVFTLTVTDLTTTCSAADDIFVDVQSNILGVAATATPENVCTGGSSQLNAFAMGGSGSYTYLWTSNPAGFTSNLPNPVVTPYTTTDYTVIVNDGTDVVYDIVTVSIVDVPLQPTTPEGPDSVNINMTPSSLYTTEPVAGAISYVWTIEPSMIGEVVASGTEATVNWLAIGRAFLTVTAINECGEATSETKVVTVDNTIGLSEYLPQMVKVYPNPVAGLLTIETGGIRVTQLTVSSISGATILVNEVAESTQPITMQTETLKPGIYFLRIDTPEGNLIQKIVKQ